MAGWRRSFGTSVNCSVCRAHMHRYCSGGSSAARGANVTSETAVQQHARLAMARMGCQVWRNNSGAYQDEHGNFIRYGLANESKQQNEIIKSSDLIGITPTLIQPHMVGYSLGVFTALEIKPSDWHMRPGDKRAIAQAKFHTIVREACGYAGFVTDPADIPRIIGR